MRTVLTALLFFLLACSAHADLYSNTWLRGASSSAVNDDATAIFVNPAGLGLYDENNTWSSLTTSGEDVESYALAIKGGGLGFGYRREFLWEPGTPELGPSLTNDAVDTYTLGLAFGDERKWAVGFDYRWINAQFGEEEKTGTWDAGLIVRPTDFLSLGGSVRNISEPDFDPVGGDGSEDCCDASTRMTYVGGLALRPVGNRLTLMADAALDREADFDDAVYTGGVEAEFLDGLVLRGSMRSMPGQNGREEELSFGVWLTGVYAAGGASYRSVEDLDEDLISFELGSSTERMRPLVTSRDGIAEIEIAGPLGDAPARWSLFGGPSTSAQRIMGDIRTAAEDPSVAALLIDLKPMGRGFLGSPPALAQEIREELLRARREHGVKIVAYLEHGGQVTDYFIATAADHIVLYPVSGIDGLGSFVNVMRYTKSTEKIGIEWDYFSAGKYKSTFHSIGADPPTEAQLEELSSMVEDNYEELLAALREGRGLSREEALEACQGGLFTAPSALDAGLVDELGHYADAKAAARRMAGGEVPDEPGEIETVDVSDWKDRVYDWSLGPKIAVIGAYGGIHTGEGGRDPIMGGSSIGSETLTKKLRHARKDGSIEAVVLRIDSGGGDATASDIIWRETARLAQEKPLIVSMADVAGSGGYYIAMAADRIFVDPLSVAGSIGVVGMKPVAGPLYDKIDATYHTVKRGEHADMWSATRHVSEEEGQMVQDAIDWFYDDFVAKVAEHRGLSDDRAYELAQGRVYTGNQAVENGLADELG
ncbi:MAG: signal peptide peptidase SppA, partial [Candidatus Eisenbacteria bacterium]|nr:signal peptide peptidase SppA [Candidatus Eisenbacteria bacterium]